MPVLKNLTDATIDRAPFATKAQRQNQIADKQQPGFYVLVNQHTKTFMCRTSVSDPTNKRGRRTVKAKIGDCEKMTCRQARTEAVIKIAELRKETDVRSVEGIILREAWEAYLLHLRGRRKPASPRTIESYENSVKKILTCWLDTPLSSLSKTAEARGRVAEMHKKLSAKHGTYAGNRAFELLRAVYNYAYRTSDGLPVKNACLVVDWNEEHVADEGLTREELRKWWASVNKADNPIRRALHAFICLSGHRPTAIKEARWEHLDEKKRALRIPNPKGGESRAFDMPLSRPMLRVLRQAKKAGRMLHEESAKTYIFPNADGPIVEHKQKILTATHKALRHTYSATANELGVAPLFLKLLMNHKVRDVTEGYAAGSSLFPVLITEQERISEALIRA